MVCPDECYQESATECSQGSRDLDVMQCSAENLLVFKVYFPAAAVVFLLFTIYAFFQVRVIVAYQKEVRPPPPQKQGKTAALT